MDDITRWEANGLIKGSIDRIFDLENASDAHEYIENGLTTGKLLIKI